MESFRRSPSAVKSQQSLKRPLCTAGCPIDYENTKNSQTRSDIATKKQFAARQPHTTLRVEDGKAGCQIDNSQVIHGCRPRAKIASGLCRAGAEGSSTCTQPPNFFELSKSKPWWPYLWRQWHPGPGKLRLT